SAPSRLRSRPEPGRGAPAIGPAPVGGGTGAAPGRAAVCPTLPVSGPAAGVVAGPVARAGTVAAGPLAGPPARSPSAGSAVGTGEPEVGGATEAGTVAAPCVVPATAACAATVDPGSPAATASSPAPWLPVGPAAAPTTALSGKAGTSTPVPRKAGT